MKKLLIIFAIGVFALTIGCKGFGIAFVERDSEPVVPDGGEGYLMFGLRRLGDGGPAQRYDCTFNSGGKAARFQFEVFSKPPSGDPTVPSTTGRIIAVPGSDASEFLHKLQKTLQAKNFPTSVQRVTELPFTAVILGTSESHAVNGGFFDKPSGNWTAMKIFIGKKDESAEVFLNFNPVLGKGEFSIKDPDYGDDVLKELAKVL